MQLHQELITHSSHGETCGDVLAQEKSRAESQKVYRSLVPREGMFAERREVRDCFEFRAYKAIQEEEAAYLNSLKRNIIRDYFLRSRAIKYCLKHDRK